MRSQVRGRGGGEPVGIVSGDSRPDYFIFSVDPQNIPQLYDYVYVEVEETPPGSGEPVTVKVLAQIRSLKWQALGVTPDKPWAIIRNYVPPKGSDSIVAVAKVLGYKWRGRIYVPRRAPPVGSWVYLAPDSLLEDFYSVEPSRRLHVGSLISRPTVPAYLDVEGFKRHVAIIAATGAGKTWASVILIEELLKKGATIVVLDPHGEYTAMKRSAFKLGPGFESRVRIVKARRDQEGDIQYRVSVADMSSEELLSVMGVPSKASKIRSVISAAKLLSKVLAEASGSRRWLGLRGIYRIIQAAIDAAELTRNTGSSKALHTFANQLRLRLVRLYARLYGEEGADAKAFDEKLQALSAEDRDDSDFNRAVRRLWLALSRDTEPGFAALRYVEELRRIGVYGVSSLPLSYLLQPGTVTVVNLAGLREEVQDHVAYNILLRIFNARLRHVRGLEGESYPYPVVVFVEEAHRFMPPKSKGSTRSRDVAATIASEGRKFGVFMVAISQRPSRIDPDVLSQLQGQIILRIVNPRDQEAVRDSSEQVSQDLLDNLPGLNTGEAVVVGPITPSPLMVRLRDRVLEYSGGDISLVEAWTGSLEDLRVVEEYRREVREKLSAITGGLNIEEAVSELLGDSVPRSVVDEALRVLAVGRVWASYNERSGTLYGEVSMPGFEEDVRVTLGEYKCRGRRECTAAVAVLLRAVLDGVLAAPSTGGGEKPDSWWY